MSHHIPKKQMKQTNDSFWHSLLAIA
uniref:Uncharacterized protein n=1 Tax=Anguilla anguilla TaxID=7936 RepID=A0A0E9TF29_ANGAN